MSKKHYTQLSNQEREAIYKLLDGEFFYFSDYALGKMNKRGIMKWDVIEAINAGDLIEYHFTTGKESRALFRGKKSVKCNEEVCAVIDLVTNVIVTAYLNCADDEHCTIEMSNYDENLDMLNCLAMSVKAHKYAIFKFNKTRGVI